MATPGKQYSLGAASRADKPLDVGDPVRIESLGLEGTVQFMGEADFKEGVWAGVELFPNFVGRGKNDGSVAGCVLQAPIPARLCALACQED